MAKPKTLKVDLDVDTSGFDDALLKMEFGLMRANVLRLTEVVRQLEDRIAAVESTGSGPDA